MTLCVDAIEPELTGIGRYAWELAKRLPKRREISGLSFYARHQVIEDPTRLARGERITRGGLPKRLLRRLQARRAFRASLVHGPNFFLPPDAETGVITVHDLSVLRYPETHPTARVAEFERKLASSIIRAAHVITDTETVRQEVMAEFSLEPECVTAVPLGIDPSFAPRAANQVRELVNSLSLIPGSYGLSVATLEPRKRISELVRAWGSLPRPLRDRFPLVVAGSFGWRNEDLLIDIAKGQAQGWLRHLGFVDEEWLPALYAGAALFVYPSIYEGFGLPPLEAMASGTPVMVSNRSCLPEVCADAVCYIDPDDVEGMAAAIEGALSDQDWRGTARIAGLKRAASFTWERCVDETIAVYRSAWRG